MLKTYFIYILINPLNGHTFYVGRTSWPLITKENMSFGSVQKSLFFESHLKMTYIKNMGCDPVLAVIDRIECTPLAFKWGYPRKVLMAEKYWIEKFMDMGMQLQNINWLKEDERVTA